MSFRSFDLLNLVRDFGSDVTLRKTSTAGTYNPATGAVDGAATTDYTVSSYFFNFSVLFIIFIFYISNIFIIFRISM